MNGHAKRLPSPAWLGDFKRAQAPSVATGHMAVTKLGGQ